MRLFEEGHAVPVGKKEKPSGVEWYLPHFTVKNTNKPDKVRVVFDASPKVKGISLNNQLMSGPELIRPLFLVLLNFRIGRVGLKSDIRDMYLRVRMRESDQDAQRF